MTTHSPQARLDRLALHWNEAEIPRPSLDRWLAQFEADDQGIALRLLECIEMHSWARLLRNEATFASWLRICCCDCSNPR